MDEELAPGPMDEVLAPGGQGGEGTSGNFVYNFLLSCGFHVC